MAPTIPYKYQKLSRSSSIRLLSILPEPDGTTKYSLTTHHLRDAPRYEAISYTWGPPDTKSFILCDGQRLPVTPSCASMLDYLRTPTTPRRVWIDQICIDQSDIPERSHQVTLMTQIYSTAWQVVVWIGECGPADRRCLELLSVYDPKRANLALAKQRTALWEQSEPLGGDFLSCLPSFDDVEPWLEEQGWAPRALEAILRRPYFLRVWILQEVAVARNVTLMCGRITFDMQKLFSVCALLQSLAPGDLLYPWNAVFCLDIFREDYASNGTLDVGEAFLRPFVRTRDCLATDGRDKIYALRGICRDLQAHTPLPDYHKSEVEVFLEAAKASLQADEGRLSMLSYGIALRDLPGLPSWCPDFGGPVMKTGVAAHSTKLREKSKNPTRLPVITGKQLLVRGKIVDQIAQVTAVSTWEDKTASPLEQEFATWHSWYQFMRAATSSYGKEPMAMAFWRTLFNDSEDWLTPQSAAINEEAARFVDYVDALHERFLRNDIADPPKRAGWDDWVLVKKNVEDAKKYSRNKRACVTKGNYFGMVLPHAQVGDVVVYLEGASILHVLRPTSGTKTYTVVGPCYIHGLMNGEKYPWKGLGLAKLVLV